ncbi:hypothetical protein [Brevibacterium litoralis]|uniref:hypothetical protein n=1 Tax=Brevibacterium litoralis TaxID=3138935 RepID=UPI0032EDBD0A
MRNFAVSAIACGFLSCISLMIVLAAIGGTPWWFFAVMAVIILVQGAALAGHAVDRWMRRHHPGNAVGSAH